jgi:hypothetical protein
MRDLVRSSVNTGIAITAAGALAITPAALPAEPHSPPTVVAGVRLSAATTLMPATPPLGALVQQFLANQVTDCSLICPFIIQGATQPLINFAIIPVTFAAELSSGQPLLQAIALTDATVSGAANAALTGIITNDLNAALPRAQHSLEVAVVGLIDIGTTAITQPGNLLQAINTARTDLFGALQQPPGPTPPAVHNALEAAAVRVIEVASAITFQAPERLLLGVTQAADALFTTLGNTGNVGAALGAAGASVATTVSESVAFIRHALTEPIPISAAATMTAVDKTKVDTTTTTTAPTTTATTLQRIHTPTTKPLAVATQLVRSRITAGGNAASAQQPSATGSTKPVGLIRQAEQTVNRVVAALGNNKHRAPENHVTSQTAADKASAKQTDS